MSDRREKENYQPITTAALVGLEWGLVWGLIEGLPALLEGDPAVDLGRRLLALTYVAVFNAVVFGLVLGAVGGIVWVVLRLTRRQVSRAAQAGGYAGLCAALSTLAFGLHRFQEAAPVLVVALALVAGGGAGLLVRAAVASMTGTPRTGRYLRKGVLAVVGSGFLVLLAASLYHNVVRDMQFLNPRITDRVATAERPNIVLISIDALRADRLGAYGSSPAISPNIDALAQRGLVFEQPVAQGSSTVPSVTSFLTSLHPTEAGIITGRKWNLDEMRVTLAEALQVAGYRTQAYVTNGHLVPARGYAQGFDGYVPPEPHRAYGVDRLQSETTVAGLACRNDFVLCQLFESGYASILDLLLQMENEGDRVNELAQRFVRLHKDEQFFLWLHYMEPHAAYRPYQAAGDLPPTVDEKRENHLRAWQPSNKTVPVVMRPDDVSALLALYEGEVLDVDRWVGGVWEEVEAQGLADRTLLVITADHGDEFAEHGEFGHGHTVYQGLDWVPLIFVGPQIAEPGRRVATPVPLLDIMPTLLDAAGAPLPDLVQGQSLLPVLKGDEPPERSIVSECPARRTSYDDKSLRQGDYKLVYNVKLDKVELYNLRSDPGEQQDLAAAEPERAAAMRDELRAWTTEALQTWVSLPQAGDQAGEVDEAMEDALRQIGY